MTKLNIKKLRLQFLDENREFLPTLAKWYFEEWGHEDKTRTIEIETEDLYKALNRNNIPLTVTAIIGEELVGAGQLKWKEMSIYPEKNYWLGGILVRPESRNHGVARRIIEKLTNIASSLSIQKLYLQTEQLDGGLYARMGWNKIDRIVYQGTNILVMEKLLLKKG